MQDGRLQRGSSHALLSGGGCERALSFAASQTGVLTVAPPRCGFQNCSFYSMDRSGLPVRKGFVQGVRLVRSGGQESLFLCAERCGREVAERCRTRSSSLI